MRALRFIGNLVLVLASVATFGACAKTNMTSLWMDEDAAQPVVDNILVIALDRDFEMRRFWEDAIAAEFNGQGLLARQSYQVFPADLPDSQQVAVVLERDQHDAAIVAHRLTVVPNEVRGGGYRDNAPGGSSAYWRRGYMVALSEANLPRSLRKDMGDEDIRYQLDLARADGRLIWTGTTLPIDPKDEEKLRTEVAGQVVPELQRRKIIPKE